MAMNLIGWLPNYFKLEIPEMERQVSNWCNMNSREKTLLVFEIEDLRNFLKKNKLHRVYTGKSYMLSTKELEIIWDEMEDHWGFIQKIFNRQNGKLLYKAPEKPGEADGVMWINN